MPRENKDREEEIRGWLALEEEVFVRALIDQMISKAKKAAEYANRKFGATVYLFGSLAKNRVHNRSDIDLLICGDFSETQKREMTLEIESIVAPHLVDVLFADEVSAQMKRAIMERGIELTC